jgi:hypothetical protein
MIESSDIVNSLSDIDLKQICEGIIFPLSLDPRDVLMATQLLREEDILSFEINLSKLQVRFLVEKFCFLFDNQNFIVTKETESSYEGFIYENERDKASRFIPARKD